MFARTRTVGDKDAMDDWTPQQVNLSHAKPPTARLPGDHMSTEERMKIQAAHEDKIIQETAIRKQKRAAEEGRAGGLNDKNAPLDPNLRARNDEDGVDDSSY